MTRNPIDFLVDVDDAGYLDRVEPTRTEPFEWLNLLDVVTEPAALIERALTEVDSIQRCGMRQPRKARGRRHKHAGAAGYPCASHARH